MVRNRVHVGPTGMHVLSLVQPRKWRERDSVLIQGQMQRDIGVTAYFINSTGDIGTYTPSRIGSKQDYRKQGLFLPVPEKHKAFFLSIAIECTNLPSLRKNLERQAKVDSAVGKTSDEEQVVALLHMR